MQATVEQRPACMTSTPTFTTDTILRDLYEQLAQHPEDDGMPVSEGNIRLLNHTDIAAFITLYREDGKLWTQICIGYMYNTLPRGPKKNFREFMNRRKHNPLRLPSGQAIDLRHCFVNAVRDPEHRWGFDLIVDDVGFEKCAELFDYLLTTHY